MLDQINSISAFSWVILGIGVITILEVLFLCARIIENELGLHRLKIRSHALRYQMKMGAAEQIVEDWAWERERTGKPWDEIIGITGEGTPSNMAILPDDMTGEFNDSAQFADAA